MGFEKVKRLSPFFNFPYRSIKYGAAGFNFFNLKRRIVRRKANATFSKPHAVAGSIAAQCYIAYICQKRILMDGGFDLQKPVAIGGDHAGFQYKELIIEALQQQGLTVTNFGAHSTASVDYPDFAHPVANAVERGEAGCGILICGSANGVAIAANKHQGIRAAICWMEELAQLARQHNNANIICIPARFVSQAAAQRMIELFLDTPFEGGRHQTRVAKIACA